MNTEILVERLLALHPEARQAILRGGPVAPLDPCRLEERPASSPALPFQEAQWTLWRMAPANPAYHVPICYDVRGPLDISALQGALRCLQARHESLRATFHVVAGRLHQFVDDDLTDVVEVGRTDGRLAALSDARQAVTVPFDLENGSPFRCHVWRYGPQQHLLLLLTHHIATDERSTSVIATELHGAYCSLVRGHEPELGPPPPQCRQLVSAAEQAAVASIDYWVEALRGATPSAIPVDRQAGSRSVIPGTVVVHEMGAGSLQLLYDAARAFRTTPYVISAACTARLLSRWTNGEDPEFGTPMSWRDVPGAEGTVGYLLNTVAIRLRADELEPVSATVRRASDVVAAARTHAGAPFAEVVSRLGARRGPYSNPLFDVMLVHLPHQASTRQLELSDDLHLEQVSMPLDGGLPYVIVSVIELDDRLALSARYAADQYDETTMRGHLEELAQVFEAAWDPLVQHPTPRQRLESS